MRVIDFHTHVFRDDVAPAAVPIMAERGGIAPHFDGTVAGLTALMDASGIAASVVQPVATKPTQVRSINDWLATIESDRILPFGAMHPDYDDPRGEIERIAGLGMRGIKLHPEHQAFEPHEPRMQAIYDAAAEFGMVVFFHAGADLLHDTLRGTPESFAAVLDARPGLSIVLAHLGGFRQWEGALEMLAGRDVWLDTAYTLGHMPDDDWLSLVRAHGTDRVLFGSDGPWADPASEIERMQKLGLAEDELAAILGGNAERLLAR